MRTTFFKAVCITGLLGAVSSAQAQQGGARMSGDLSQNFDVTDNNNLAGSGFTFKSLTSLNFRLSSQTPTSSAYAATGISLRLNKGGFALKQPKLTLGFTKSTKLTNYSGSLSYIKAPVAVDETQPDLSILRVEADRTVISGRVGVNTRLNETTRLSFGATASTTDFDPVTISLVPSTNLGLTGSIKYQLNSRTSYGFNSRLGYFEADGGNNTTSISADLGAQLDHQLTNTTKFDGNLGVSLIDSTDTISGVETSAFSVSLLFGAGLTQALPDGSIGVSVSQSVNPSASGSLALGTRLSGSYKQQVNQNESYGIDASLGRQEDIGGGAVTTFINVSPSYSRQLTRDVSATASYYVQRDDTGSMAQGLTVSFTRPFDFPAR